MSIHQGFISPDAAKRQSNIDHTTKCIELASKLGIGCMRVNTGTWGTSKSFDHLMENRGIESPLAGYTEKIVYLADHQMALVTADHLRVTHRDQGHVQHSVEVLNIQTTDVDLGGYAHYMLKEIFEQPESLKNTMRGRLNDDDATAVFGGLNLGARRSLGERRDGKSLWYCICVVS